jgi:NADH dehydrogenase FAD-containing subunit
LGFDPGLLREKYAAERAKLRADGNRQYREITGQFEHYHVDPYVESGFTGAALQKDLDVVIIGGGLDGMLAAVRLQEVGITNFRIIEKAGGEHRARFIGWLLSAGR